MYFFNLNNNKILAFTQRKPISQSSGKINESHFSSLKSRVVIIRHLQHTQAILSSIFFFKRLKKTKLVVRAKLHIPMYKKHLQMTWYILCWNTISKTLVVLQMPKIAFFWKIFPFRLEFAGLALEREVCFTFFYSI